MTTEAMSIEQTLRQIGEGRNHIDRIKAMIVRKDAASEDSLADRELLAQLEEGQHLYLAHLTSLKAGQNQACKYRSVVCS